MPAPEHRDRRARDESLAATPAPFRSFHYFSATDDGLHVRTEVVDAIYAMRRLTDLERAMRIAEVNTTLRAAARGELRGSEQLDPVRTQPTLWELRWKWRHGVEGRMYHAEPAGGRPDMVALLFHRKHADGDSAEIKNHQDAEMQLAADRYAEGEARRWGHRTRGCADCLLP
jgi:hypothetical protein